MATAPAAAQQPSPELVAKNRAAAEAMNAGRFDEAAGLYRELLAAVPGEPGLLMNLGMALAMGGHEAEAIQPLEKAVAMRPSLLPAQMFLGTSYLALGQPEKAIPPLERVVAAQPKDLEARRVLAQALAGAGRLAAAVTQLRRATEIAPKEPATWYALGHGYNAITQEAMATFDAEPADSPWRQLLVADALMADGRLTDAFTLYRRTLEALPRMVSIHDSIAKIYEQTGHKDWAETERQKGKLTPAQCAARKALCEFRAGRYRPALVAALNGTDPESRYWRARAGTELALQAFNQLESLPDSRERREARAQLARAQRRHVDSVVELEAALKFAPGDPMLLEELAYSQYLARNYEASIDIARPLVDKAPDNARLLTIYGDALLQLQRIDEALPVLRRAHTLTPDDPLTRAALGRALVSTGDFAGAIPLLESQLAEDVDGSLHIQLARAYTGLGQKDKATPLLERAQAIQRDQQEKGAAAGEHEITPP